MHLQRLINTRDQWVRRRSKKDCAEVELMLVWRLYTICGQKRESDVEKEQKKEERYNKSYTLDKERLELEKEGLKLKKRGLQMRQEVWI
ncbi:hypothetical protein C2845_PM03G14880 [Panicum miliaceum]|uniref:Uncharacterized protein n=1 Tax=Panicum miliaceum TaxID=4540 RepID=A0A3L6T6R0_PANMI|nr:hypothetical protein C2845_PM03G14880 [Panicum miliaceum]